MSAKEYCIQFTYDTVNYLGLVRPFVFKRQIHYKLAIESEDQQMNLVIILRLSLTPPDALEFYCPDGSKADNCYDKEFLREIGEQVEACLTYEAESVVDNDLLFGLAGQLRNRN